MLEGERRSLSPSVHEVGRGPAPGWLLNQRNPRCRLAKSSPFWLSGFWRDILRPHRQPRWRHADGGFQTSGGLHPCGQTQSWESTLLSNTQAGTPPRGVGGDRVRLKQPPGLHLGAGGRGRRGRGRVGQRDARRGGGRHSDGVGPAEEPVRPGPEGAGPAVKPFPPCPVGLEGPAGVLSSPRLAVCDQCGCLRWTPSPGMTCSRPGKERAGA